MDGFLYSFLEAVPRLVVLRHLLQLGARLLVLRLLVDSENSSSKSLASAPDSESVSATRISLTAASSSFIFFAAIAKCTAQ